MKYITTAPIQRAKLAFFFNFSKPKSKVMRQF